MITAIIIGSLLGAVAGLLPGVGVFTALLVALPFLSTMDPVNVLILYVAIASVSQFVGSVPAIMLGIPGEASSIPAVTESKNLITQEEKSTVIVQTAIGSAFGSLFVLGLTLLALPWMSGVFGFYLTTVQLALYVVVALVICWTSGNTLLTSVGLFVFGLGLGSIGYSQIFSAEILTFGQTQLINGLPAVVVIAMLFALPQVWQSMGALQQVKASLTAPLKFVMPNLGWSGLWSIIGFFGGLVPGMTTILSSQAAYNVSKWLKQGPGARILAAEVANNAGAFSQLLPMLLLGIPILSSEALLLGIIESKGLTFTLANFADHMGVIAIALLFINAIGLLLAWPLSSHLTRVYQLPTWAIMSIILTAIAGGVILSGIQASGLAFYCAVSLALLPVAWALRKVNTAPLVFGFLIYPLLLDNAYRFLILYNFISI